MNRIFKLLNRKLPPVISIITVFTLLAVNVPVFILYSSISGSEDCCHIQNSVKTCCVINHKITGDERLAEHCGCSMNENRVPADMIADLQCSLVKPLKHSLAEPEPGNYGYVSAVSKNSSTVGSPPVVFKEYVYLSNLNLRI